MNTLQHSHFSFLFVLLAGLALGRSATTGVMAGPSGPVANAGWQEVGAGSASGTGISNNSDESGGTATAIAADGTYFVAWADRSSGNYEIYIRRWDGAAWVEMGAGSATGGGISRNAGESLAPSLALDPEGNPVIAWQDKTGGDAEIYVRRWDGAVWVEMGDASASGGGISNNVADSLSPSLAVNADGNPIVAWNDIGSGDWEVYAKQWNGSAWVEIGGSAAGGGISNNTGWSEHTALAVAPDGAPHVTWYDNSGGDWEIYARKWTGSAWSEIGNSASGGGISDNTTDSRFPSLAFGSDGNPIVTWYDRIGGDLEIYVKRWNGAAWVEMGSGSASGGGISDNSVDSYAPYVVVSPAGVPVIAWMDQNDGDFDIFVKQWTGAAWVELGSGSATSGGISDNDSDSVHPSMAVAPDGSPVVAWKDYSGGNAEIYVRRLYTHPSCRTLTTTHTGGGENPAATPGGYVGCGAGRYIGGQAIALAAAPTIGWRVKNWTGTADDSSTSLTNALTMPDADHTVAVLYEVIPDTTFLSFFPQIISQPSCFGGPTETEPNNGPQTANGPLCPGVVIQGLPGDRWDMFHLQTTQAGDIAAELIDHFGGGVQLQLYYQSVDGTPDAQDTDDGDGLSVMLSNGAPGRYYVLVFSETPNPAETRYYRLHVTIP